MFRHIVLFLLRPDASDQQAAEALSLLQQLGEGAHPGLLQWRIRESQDTRKGRILIEDSAFASREAYEQFRGTPIHASVAAYLSQVADWWVGDYEI